MADGNRKRRAGRALSVFGGAVGVSLIAAIFYWIPFDGKAFFAQLLQVDPRYLVAVVGSTIFHCYLTGRKWRLVTIHTAVATDLGVGYYLYSSLIALLGHLLPLQVAVLAGRSLAMRLHGQVPMTRSAAGAAYDQIFDVLVPAVVLVPSIFYFLGILDLDYSAAVAVVSLLLVGLGIARYGDSTISILLLAVERRVPRLGNAARAYKNDGLSSGRLMGTLYAYSVLRFTNLVFRACLIAWALGLDIHWIPIAFSSTVVTFSLLFSFVPGGLGFLEWGWIGALQTFGITETVAVHYALSSRIFIVAALLTINIVHVLLVCGYLYCGQFRPNKARE